MLDPDQPAPDVGRNETLARFILSRSHFRPSDGTAKQNALVPHPHTALSVNRDLEATDDETWQVGHRVAHERRKTLYGRADALAATYISQSLRALAKPLPGNPNHVDVVDWPEDKAAQKNIAQEIAAVANFRTTPTEGSTQGE